MQQAKWNGVVVAESDQTIVVEGNHYFPPDSINMEYFKPSDAHTFCPWKGAASYYDIIVDGEDNQRAAWYYPNPSKSAKRIQNYIAFWRGVRVNNF